MTLQSGEARFTVKHDERDPFTVIVGDQRLIDVGTVFNVVKSADQMCVAVAEGAVRYEGLSRVVELEVGDALSADDDGSIRINRESTASIGSWADARQAPC